MDLHELPPFSPDEKRAIKITRVVVFVVGTMLLILFSVNTYKYLIKQQKYKVLTITLFYIVALISIVLVMATAYITPYYNYCKLDWLLLSYGVAYTNLLLGVCQGGTIAILGIQLQCLFTYSKSLIKTDLDAPYIAEQEMLKSL